MSFAVEGRQSGLPAASMRDIPFAVPENAMDKCSSTLADDHLPSRCQASCSSLMPSVAWLINASAFSRHVSIRSWGLDLEWLGTKQRSYLTTEDSPYEIHGAC